jgi:Protein of unknown function (DUF1822)
MNNYSNDFDLNDLNDLLLDEEALPLETMMLSSHQIDQAIHLSESIPNPVEQWQGYLNGLAKLGLQQWFRARVPKLTCALLPNQNLQVGAFQLYVVTMGSFTDDWLTVSLAGIENPEAHFYVLVEVLEEQEQVRICGYLRQDELMHHRQSQPLQREGEQSYLLPLNWFDFNADHLLLYVQHLDPDAIRLPVPSQPPLINVGHWLRDRLDEIAEDLSWVLLPPPTYASAMRGGVKSPVDQFDGVMTNLMHQGVEISSQARGAYRDVQLGNQLLRLYVVTWKITRSSPMEWTLLVILGSQSGERLPAQIKLRVRDDVKLLNEQVLPEDQTAAHLYIQAFGALDERLWVAIANGSGEVLTLPPFTLSDDE